MKNDQNSNIRKFMIGTSVLAILATGQVSLAQDTSDDEDEIVVTGIRQSLKEAMEIKRDSVGVVDAITAEDIGKFPDTNLAESLQRIPGIAIDRSLGEGSTVTVRGWGADFNLVTLNGRVMPTSTLAGGASAPSSRSFDFGNLASEAISAVEVYKTSKAHVASGGAGATLNIKTTQPLEAPGRTATIGVKGVYDTSQNFSDEITPEISGLYSNTFANDTIGVAVSGSYQKRKGGVAQANVGWRDGYLGSDDFENEWGRLPRPGSWNYIDGVTNSPGPTDVYEVPQNADYEVAEFNRERINGQLTLQYEPMENFRATADYTFAQNEIEVAQNTAGIWFDHAWTNSAWTDGPVAGPLFYTEFFGATDLSYSGSLTQNKTEANSFGLNLDWDVSDRLNLVLDAHDSSSKSAPNNPYGSNMSLGTTSFGIAEQSINFENDLPVISYVGGANGVNPEDISTREISGSAFRNALMDSDVQQVQLTGNYDVSKDIVDSFDFGVGWVKNDINRAFGVLQTDSWGGELGGPEDIPDDLFELVNVQDLFGGASGADSPNIINSFYRFDFETMAELAESQFGICSTPWNGTPNEGTCLAQYTTNEFLEEETFSGFVQMNNTLQLFGRDAHITAGMRYEHTDVVARNETPIFTGTTWAGGGNEFFMSLGEGTNIFSYEGGYDYLLPSIDFDASPGEYLKARLSYSKTFGRQTYDKLGGLNYSTLFRTVEGEASGGNPDLKPLVSENYDASLEWYYGDDSYISVGAFRKDVKNFTTTGLVDPTTIPGIHHPFNGPRADEARAALGNMATSQDIYNYIVTNYPGTLNAMGQVTGQPDDELVSFRTSVPVVSDETHWFQGLEFAVQHMFGDSGFGVIANYTIADTDISFDNTLSFREEQIALPGVSDSANLVALYDKNGIQARVAYNWRDQFLAGGTRNPFYRESYDQIDASASWDVRDGFTLFVEGINLTGTDARGHRRSKNNVFFYNNGKPRYAAGARYKF